MSMTVEEAIAIIEDVTWNGCGRHYETIPVAREMAILALEQVQKYRAIGTVSEFRELKEKATEKKLKDVRYFGEAGYYIGLCPTCKSGNNSEYEYCGDCGQKLQWFERSEGKE